MAKSDMGSTRHFALELSQKEVREQDHQRAVPHTTVGDYGTPSQSEGQDQLIVQWVALAGRTHLPLSGQEAKPQIKIKFRPPFVP